MGRRRNVYFKKKVKNMEYSIFEKIKLLLENFESINEFSLLMNRTEMVLKIKLVPVILSKEEVMELIKEYFQDYEITIIFSW